RLLRPRRQRRDAPAQGPPPGRGRRQGGPMTQTAEVNTAVSRVRETVARLHGELTRNGLVAWTAGNVSGRVPGHDLMVIKPSGGADDGATPASTGVWHFFGA